MIASKMFFKQLLMGKFTLILSALTLATATVCVIALMAGAIQSTLQERATHLLAGDAQIRGSQPIPESWIDRADGHYLNTAQALQFRSMVFSDSHNQLFSVKAVGNQYPLKGQIQLSDGASKQGPERGEIYAPVQLLNNLAVSVGDRIFIGDAELVIARELVREPDNLRGNFGFAPTLLMNLNDVPQTGVIQAGSRYNATLYLAGEADRLESYRNVIETELGEHFSWNTLDQANRSIVEALEKAESFIILGIVLAVLLSGIAIGLGTRKYALEQVSQTALLKTLGFGPRRVGQLFLIQIHMLAALGVLPGFLFGWLSYTLLAQWIAPLVPDLQSADNRAYGLAGLTVYLTLLAFAAPYFWRLHKVSPLAALRDQYHSRMLNNRLALLFGFGVLVAVSVLFSGKPALVFYISIALAVCYFSSALFAYILSTNLHHILRPRNIKWALGIKNLHRHHQQNVPQIVMFSILFTLLFTLALLRTSLVDQWRTQLPDNAPNIFAFNIFAEDKQQLSEFFTSRQMAEPVFYPMVRARIVSLNGTPLEEVLQSSDSGINYEREMNLTWTRVMGEDNTTIEGEFWPHDDTLYASLESEFAKGLNTVIGDKLTISIQGQNVTMQIAHIRNVEWDSLNPNFFIIANQEIGEQVQSNWLTSFHMPAEYQDSFNQWLRDHPTLTVIELDQTIKQIQEITSQVSLTIELIGALVLLSGILVLIASLQMTLNMRAHEGALLRVFGAPSQMVSHTLATEFFFVSSIAAFMACVATEVAVNLLAWKVFELPATLHLKLWLIAPLLIIPTLTWVSRFATRKIIAHPPLTTLRRMEQGGG